MAPLADVYAESERLARERANVRQEKDRLAVRRQELTTRVPELERAWQDALARKARGAEDAQAEAERVFGELSEARQEQVATYAGEQAAAQADQQLEGEREQLYIAELPQFIPAAEALSHDAAQATLAAEQALRDAQAAWVKAEAAWRPLRAALKAHVDRVDHDTGVIRSGDKLERDVSPVGFPFGSFGGLFAAIRTGILSPRPPALTALKEPDDVLDIDLRTRTQED